MRWNLLLTSLWALAGVGVWAQDGTAVSGPDPDITAADLSAHVSFLASDELEGRATGSEGNRKAARYLARVLAESGLQPAGADGTFLQPVPLANVEHTAAPELRVVLKSGAEFPTEYGVHFTVSVRGEARSTPELRFVLAKDLDGFPAAPDAQVALAVDGNSRERRQLFEERGIDGPDGFGLYVRLTSKRPGKKGARLPYGGLQRLTDDEVPNTPYLSTRGELYERLLAGDVKSLQLTFHTSSTALDESNVVGLLPGVGTPERPELANEAIVFTAHYDHIGMRKPESDGAAGSVAEAAASDAPDLIFNGADDDASGTAAVLELAQAFAAGPAPARTLVFLLATGEERGLLGTYHYLDDPVVPLDQTVCNLNFEMIGRPDELVGGSGKLWLTGFELTTLGPAFQDRGFDVVPDLRPEQNFFRRSDNYAFVQRGIVGQTLSSYNMHKDYHRVTDEADTLDYQHMEAALRSAYDAARLLADGEVTPAWLETDADAADK